MELEGGIATHTMIVKAAPLFAMILCLWFGRLLIPISLAIVAVGIVLV